MIGTRSTLRAPLSWQRTPVLAAAFCGAVLLAGAGLVLGRPDVIATGLPLALAGVWALLRPPRAEVVEIALSLDAAAGADSVAGVVEVGTDAEWMQLAVDQGGERTGEAETRAGEAARSRTRILHSGPSEALAVTARALHHDGAWASAPTPRVSAVWAASPRARRIAELPLSARLIGLHGGHDGQRGGSGGDFRDIHPFAPGDELRRVDWRATARAARRPGDLLVRRTNALSDSAVVIALDTADDLGAVVATWGSGATGRSGPTSMDLGREAALSLASAAIEAGDRVAFHALSPGGRTLRSGSGARHLERLRGVIAGTGADGDGTRYRRTPPVPPGSIVFVLSTFFDGAAADLALRWSAGGQAVVAIDVLPTPRTQRLSAAQSLAMRTLLLERTGVLDDLRGAGVDVVSWDAHDPMAALRIAARIARRDRGRGVRR
ncbi:DUF58 domain-containing protein [Microbacterium sp. 13-71-7]|uniref:DUF58 domain-containing protein n=1 Tax=Microbacterium sp. 13-71-7 TaxID=1970399 RepID=UPI000BDA9656|nr:DUF58 domain-containing protein [Microbacterium sp. 13-71-7]OZB85630.1 MAG: DUF58 domain-containing protein [Microbacterium sp. 13-71-7]